MRRWGWLVVVAIAACSDENVATTGTAIQGGMLDGTAHPYALGLCVGGKGSCGGGLCSAALIAPNLAITARHCVSQTPQSIDCNTSVFGGQKTSTGNFWITTNNYLFQGTTGWHQAKQIVVPNTNKVCGQDVALLILNDNVSSNEATPVRPLVWDLMTDHKKYSTSHTAIGFGNNGSGGSGTRRIKTDMLIQCIPGDKTIPCPGSVDPNEFYSDDGVCSGDSGSSAYEQISFNNNNPITFGIAARAGFQNGNCIGSVYQRTDAHTMMIVQTAISAAQQGGYQPPPWTTAPPPPMDAGVDSGVADSGVDAGEPDTGVEDSGVAPAEDSGVTLPPVMVPSSGCNTSGSPAGLESLALLGLLAFLQKSKCVRKDRTVTGPRRAL